MGLGRKSKSNEKCRKIGIRVLKFLVSTFGMVILTLSWIMLGGWMFNYYETAHERRCNTGENERVILDEKLNETIQIITEKVQNQTLALQHNKIIRENIKKMMQASLDAKDNDWNGDVKNVERKTDLVSEWTVSNSVLFSATVVTTIGYGHIAPKSEEGRIMTILYALIGIPITLVTLAKIGHILGLAFRYGYYYFNKCIWTVVLTVTASCRPAKKKKIKKIKKTKEPIEPNEPKELDEPTEPDQPKESNELAEPGYENANADNASEKSKTKSNASADNRKGTIKLEEHASSQIGVDIEANKDSTVYEENTGGLFSICFACFGKKDNQDASLKEVSGTEHARHAIQANTQKTQAIEFPQVNHSDSKSVDNSQDRAKDYLPEASPIKDPSKDVPSQELTEYKPGNRKTRKKSDKTKAREKIAEYQKIKRKIAREQAKQQIRVPIAISLLLIVVYVMLGALIFSETAAPEEGWTFLIGCYFCFTTISTIGFGDYVFGQKNTSHAGSDSELFGTCVYILIGLSLNSMCIDLVAFEIQEKARQIALNLGFVEDDDTDDEEEEEEDPIMRA